jgi:signal transduction histidine kinase
MDVKSGNRTAIPVALFLLFTIAFMVIGWFLLPQLRWTRSNTNICIHALIGLLALMGGAITLLRIRKDLHLSNVLLFSAFLFLGILHLIAAVLFIIGFIPPGSTISSYRLVANILEITMFFGLLASSIFLQLFHDVPITQKDSRLVSTIIVISSIASYSFFYFEVLPLLPILFLDVLGLYLTGASVAISLSTVFFIAKSDKFQQNYHTLWFINALLPFLLIAPIYFITLITPFHVWLFAILFLLISLVSFNIAIAIPQIHSTGMNQTNSFRYAFILNLFIILPFGATFIFEFFYSTPVISYELYSLIRVGAAIILGGIAILLYLYSKQKFTRSFIPLMLAFVTWVSVDIALLVLGPFLPLYQESLVPYIVGYILVFLLLITAIYWKQNPAQPKESGLPVLQIALCIIGIVFAVGISIIIENWLVMNTPGIFFSKADRIILISLSFLNVFWFTILGYFYLQESQGKITIEILGLSFLMLWIIPGILKSIFLIWEWGWWAAELLLLGGLLVAPIIFGIAYLRSLRTAEEVEKRATLYADILAHDISNYHQAILTSLELIELDDVPEEIHKQAMEQIHQSLSRADHLIKNVRRLGKVDQMPIATFQPLDLVMYIKLAFEQVSRALGETDFILKCNQKEECCYVDANILLVDLFQNLIRNAMEYSNNKKQIEVKLKLLENRDQPWWEIQIIDFGRGIPPERKAQLFNRYMDGAHGSGLGLSVVRALSEAFGGWVAVQDRIQGDYQKGTVFLVYLPVSASKRPAT